jgi:lipopolysaccharide/colanic/teichoic acid biosynthesis glycosyltransferase
MGTGTITTLNDPRILPLGKFLRKTKINEIPQFLNVLLGDMSLVGPRPQTESDFNKFPEDIQKMIYNVMPGITGIGSIVFRDEEKWMLSQEMDVNAFYKEHIAPYKGELEVWYQQHISFFTDLKLLFLTVWVVIFPESTLTYKVFKTLPEAPEALR